MVDLQARRRAWESVRGQPFPGVDDPAAVDWQPSHIYDNYVGVMESIERELGPEIIPQMFEVDEESPARYEMMDAAIQRTYDQKYPDSPYKAPKFTEVVDWFYHTSDDNEGWKHARLGQRGDIGEAMAAVASGESDMAKLKHPPEPSGVD
jgi:hypothetical protein